MVVLQNVGLYREKSVAVVLNKRRSDVVVVLHVAVVLHRGRSVADVFHKGRSVPIVLHNIKSLVVVLQNVRSVVVVLHREECSGRLT